MTSRARLATGLLALLLIPFSESTLAAQTRTALRDDVDGTRALLDRQAGLVVRDVTLETALTRLTETSGVIVAFSPSLLRADSRKVTCDCKHRRVGEALDLLLAGTHFGYSVMDGQIALTPKLTTPSPVLRETMRTVRLASLTERRGTSAERRADSGAGELRTIPVPQVGTITGQVTDAATGRPLGGANVRLEGTRRGTTARADGRYTLTQVPAGSHTLVASMIGYSSQSVMVDVEAQATVTADFALEVSALRLDEVVVTATGEQRRRELGNAITKVNVAELVRAAPITNFQELLAGRVAGVNILPANGTVGMGARIRIRGLSSTSLSNDPIIYVDGVRVDGSAPAMSGQISIGGGEPSFFNDINLKEIESIEIVKGPSAATLYGTQAANGVIRITTKRGLAGPPQWNVYAEAGILQDPTDYPGLWFSEGRDANTGARRQCLPYQEVLGQCSITALHSRNLMHDAATSPLRIGHREQIGAQVSGGTEAARYFVSAEYEYEMGTVTMPTISREILREERGVSELPANQLNPSYQRKLNLRANLNIGLGRNADLALSSGYVTSHLQMPQTGDNLKGIYISALLGTADPLRAANPWGFAPPHQAFAYETWRDADRFINSANVNWRPTMFLTGRATLGLDYMSYDNNGFVSAGQGCAFCGQDRLGTRTVNRHTNYKYSVDLNATANFDLTGDINSRTSVGAQWHRDLLQATFNSAFVLPPGGRTINAGSTNISGEQTTESITLGTYVEQQLGWRDQLFATGAVRIDQNSAFGRDFEAAVYPKTSLSYLPIEDAGARWLNSLRLRGAYGASGLQPRATDAIRFYEPATASVFVGPGGADVPGVILGGLGNAELKPERSNEYEVGFDVVLLQNRVNGELTYYHKRTVDALVERALPGSLGAVATRIENIGEVVNKGFEFALNAVVLNRASLSWDVGLTGSTNDNELITLGEGVPPLVGLFFMNRPGYPLFGAWERTLKSWSDADGNGIITPDEVIVSDTLEFGGSTVPTRQLSLTSALSWRGMRLSGLLDYRGGFISHNVNDLFRCSFIQACREINDASVPLEEQAKAVAGAQAVGAYWEDASFIKFREASVSFTLPTRFIERIGGRSGTLTFTGRNLGTITGFNSWDPEINTAGVADGPNYNFLQAAQLRTFLVRLNLGF